MSLGGPLFDKKSLFGLEQGISAASEAKGCTKLRQLTVKQRFLFGALDAIAPSD
jgi:hypothetical protein